jgi:hypothetical protein
MICYTGSRSLYKASIIIIKSSSINSLGFIGVTLGRQSERSSDINSKSTIYLNVGMYRELAIVSY